MTADWLNSSAYLTLTLCQPKNTQNRVSWYFSVAYLNFFCFLRVCNGNPHSIPQLCFLLTMCNMIKKYQKKYKRIVSLIKYTGENGKKTY